MSRKPVPLEKFTVRAHHLWAEQWMLLTCGDFAAGKYNTMAVGWGSFGTMWGKPFAHVVVRPTRYTDEFMRQYDTFTLCAFPEKHRKAVQLLGTKSGRHLDKIAESGLTPIASAKIAAPGFAEAELIVECRQIYRAKVDPAGFRDKDIHTNYPQKDYHSIYYGEILAAFGAREFGA